MVLREGAEGTDVGGQEGTEVRGQKSGKDRGRRSEDGWMNEWRAG